MMFIESRMKSLMLYSGAATPFPDSQTDAVDGYQLGIFGRPAVAALLFAACPSHIARFVISIVIRIAVDSGFRWSRSNVLKKCKEVILPLRENFNSFATVIGIGRVFRIVTSASHRQPATIFRGVYSIH